LLILVAALTLEATSLLQNFFSRRGLMEEARMRAESQLEATRLQLMDATNQAESAVRNSIWIANWCLSYPDSLQSVPYRIVENNPTVVGSTLALVPDYSRRHPLYAPYVYRDAGRIVTKTLATEEYDYPSQSWFTKPLELGRGVWAEPYVDIGGGDVLMTTYSVPITDSEGNQAAVLTADISLSWLAQLIGNSQLYPNSRELLISRGGQILISTAYGQYVRTTIDEVAKEIDDRPSFARLVAEMRSNQSGSIQIKDDGKVHQVFYAPVAVTGWSMAIVIPDNEIYGALRRARIIERIFQLLGLGMLVLILRITAKNQSKYRAINEKKERMESELQIGRNIQMSMIPNTFPPYPERKDIDIAACLIPAKEVGGDLYDFYIRDEKLFFCIGDVSGKGVPASLVMAVTRSLFRTVSAHEYSPQRILTTMNDSMTDMNDNNMFVTCFCGILDLATGHLRYCNAGHNPPIVLSENEHILEVAPNYPLGVVPKVSFREQETDLEYGESIFLYTDGLNEAENSEHEQFTLERMETVLLQRRDAQAYIDAMKKAVTDFVGGAPQSDDLTILVIRYLNEKQSDMAERHLILHNDIRQIPQLAEFVETIAVEMKLDQALSMSLNLALEEAVTNVIMYAYPENTDGLVDIEAILREKSLEFNIIDSGKPFDPTAAPEADVTLDVEHRPIGGLGIFLVNKIMDSVKYMRKDGKNILTMTKKI